jgi:hypothetical protein
MYSSTSASTSGPCSGSGASGEAVDQVGANHYAELDQLCNPKSNSAAMRALLRCEHEVSVAGI